MRTCRRCGIEKEDDQFRTTKGHRAWVCRKCNNEQVRQYQREHRDKIKEWQQNYKNNNPERFRQMRNEAQKKYNKTHPEKIKAIRTKFYTCKALKKHAQDLKDDPERLHTDFLIKLIKGDGDE